MSEPVSAEPRAPPRTLAGATVLQIVPSLRSTAKVRSTVGAARALVRAGARAIVAGDIGEMVHELKSFGGEWLPLSTADITPGRMRANADTLAAFMAAEQVDIAHAKNPAAAWSARLAAGRNNIRLVTDLPELRRSRLWLAPLYLGALRHGDRLISHSMFNAHPMIERHRIPAERVSVIPRSIDTAHFDPANVAYERIIAMRRTWGIPSRTRIVLVPGKIAPGNGQLALVKAVRLLADDGIAGVTFVLAGDDRRHLRYARKVWSSARAEGVDALFRMAGHVADMPAAYAAADLVVVPYDEPPVYGRVVAEAQAMARPVIATSVGPLPESLGTPPRTPSELRSGWEVPPGKPAELAEAIFSVLALDPPAYRAHAARARKFAEATFSPQRTAAATLEVYASLLEAEPSKN